mgnify:FL=1
MNSGSFRKSSNRCSSSTEARRNAVAALSRCPVLPQPVAWFLGTQPVGLAAIFLTRSPAIDDETLIAIARTQGAAHAKAIGARENLSVKVVDALVALHQGQDNGRRPSSAPEPAPADTALRAREQEEQIRLQLKSLVHRDSVARAAEAETDNTEMEQALLVRFARQRERRDFSAALARMLDCSLWLTNRVLLDVSGQQLATVLVALDIEARDGILILKQFYPHLQARQGDTGRAEQLWFGLDGAACAEKLRLWIRADDITQGKTTASDVANANEEIPALPAQRPAFAHVRGTGRR